MDSLRHATSRLDLRALSAPPNLLSLLRIPMAVMVWQVARDPIALLMLAALAGLTDVLDGLAARSMPAPSVPDAQRPLQGNIGDWLDPLCDKIFLASAVMAAAYFYRPPMHLLFLILFRDVAQFLLIFVVGPMFWRHRVPLNFRANRWGKATTVLQFSALVAMIFSSSWLPPLAYACAVVGLFTVWGYTRRALRRWTSARLTSLSDAPETAEKIAVAPPEPNPSHAPAK